LVVVVEEDLYILRLLWDLGEVVELLVCLAYLELLVKEILEVVELLLLVLSVEEAVEVLAAPVV
jgi:hypothetical protein